MVLRVREVELLRVPIAAEYGEPVVCGVARVRALRLVEVDQACAVLGRVAGETAGRGEACGRRPGRAVRRTKSSRPNRVRPRRLRKSPNAEDMASGAICKQRPLSLLFSSPLVGEDARRAGEGSVSAASVLLLPSPSINY